MRQALTLILSGAIALSLGCASAPPLPSETPTPVSAITAGSGEQRIADQVILITDASGTMYVAGTFPRAKAITQSLVAALPNGDVRSSRPKPYQAGSIGFGGTERIGHDLGAFDRAGLASTAASLRVLGSVDGRGGETPYRHVLAETSSALSGRSGRAALVIVSDGLPDQADEAMASARALVAGYSGEVCIHTVHTGSDPNGAAFLQGLSALSAGCGSSTTTAALGSASAIQSFVRAVVMGAGAAPPPPDPCDQVIRLRGVEFEFDKAVIGEDSEVVLDVAAEQLSRCPNVRVRVEGHTDFIGNDAYNQRLSERRANAVRAYLAGHGVGASRLDAKGFGESRPIAPGKSDEDRARNRRVELHPIQ